MVCYVTLVQMLLQRNTFDQINSFYLRLLSKVVLTFLILVYLMILDIDFMVLNLIVGTLCLILSWATCGYVQTSWVENLINRQFEALFGMKTNDVEGFRRARSINQLFYETIPQFLLQLRILIWIRNHQEDSLSTYIDTKTLTISLLTA